jgi:hypothetical protein
MYGEGLFLRGDEVNTLTVRNCLIWNIRGWKTAFRVQRLIHSRIEGNIYRWHNWGGQNPQQGPERVLVAGLCRGGHIEVARRDLADVRTLERSTIDATDEGGVHRRYLGSAATGTVLNLTPVNTATLERPKLGDVAVDDGTNTASRKPALAVFDGTRWQHMN